MVTKYSPVFQHSSQQHSLGFTLIELIIVIVILGVLAVTAAPKFLNVQADAHIAAINGAQGAMNTAVSIFKAKSLTSGQGLSSVVEFDGVKGSHHQPYAATGTASGFASDYSSPPEIFEAAGLSEADWAYRIYIDNGSYAVVAAPRSIIDQTQPTEPQLKATQCYINYHWKSVGKPEITILTTGC